MSGLSSHYTQCRGGKRPEIAIKHLNICNVDERDSSMSFAFQLCLLHVIEAPSYQ